MCGRYVFALRPSEVRRQLEHANMPVDEAPEDNEVRQTYNFAPGYHGLVYRADVPDQGARRPPQQVTATEDREGETGGDAKSGETAEGSIAYTASYKLQAMKWGLVPFWTKRNPEYGSMLKTINCRDDSLVENRGMWTTMKQRKRCIVVCQGFYEWLKKNGGREKIPHFVKRKDGQLMCFAGLWDCVQFEGSEDRLYTYSIITTDSNKQLKFLHDRMPVIFDNGSDAIRTWLDPAKTEWNKKLQSLLKPYDGELECYPVSKDVGKVGNNSPSFIIPINSAENKSNIANFFGNQRKATKAKEAKEMQKMEDQVKADGVKAEHDPDETRETLNQEGTEDNAPLPAPPKREVHKGIKREHSEEDDECDTAGSVSASKSRRITSGDHGLSSQSPSKVTGKSRSATSNGTVAKAKASQAKAKDGSQKITAFFGK